MSRRSKVKMFKIVLTILVLALFIGIAIYLFPVMKNLSTTEGQIAFKEKVKNSGIVGLLSLFRTSSSSSIFDNSASENQ